MQLDHDEVEKLISEVECPKDFKCYKSGSEVVCKAVVTGTEELILVCLEKKQLRCEFLYFSAGFVCQCPLRAYIAKKLKK
jgi:hypothetical protein